MWNIIFHVQIHHTDYAKPRRIVTMTPNKPAVYFVADIFCGRYGFGRFGCGPCRYWFSVWPIWFFAVADIVLLWPIWLWPIWSVAIWSHPCSVTLRTLFRVRGVTRTPYHVLRTPFRVRSTWYGVRGPHHFWGAPVAQQPLPTKFGIKAVTATYYSSDCKNSLYYRNKPWSTVQSVV